MKVRVEHVSQKTIEAKWGSLDEDAQHAVQLVLLSVHLPVLSNFTSDSAKQEAQELLQAIRTS